MTSIVYPRDELAAFAQPTPETQARLNALIQATRATYTWPDHITYNPEAHHAIHGLPLGPPPELLWTGHPNPAEHPLVIPAWARHHHPELGQAIDRGIEQRRAAGLPT